MGFGPCEVVNTVGSVEGDEFGESGSGGGDVEDVDAAITEDSEVLGGGNGETGLVEGREFDGVAVKWGFEDGHLWCCYLPVELTELSVLKFHLVLLMCIVLLSV